MLDGSTLWVFIGASLALLVIPGPAVLYIVTRSMDQGRLAGLVSVFGIGVGSLFHVIAAALGVSALLMSSALLFSVVKYLGAGYLVYLGVRKLLERDLPDNPISVPPDKLSRIFYQGVVVQILNPKTALFFFAFLPQFVDPARGSAAGQIVLLGLIFFALAVCSDSIYALLAGSIRKGLQRNRVFLRAQRYVSGSIYIALGLTTAFAGHNSNRSK
jgi:threonine/homoserine/homoserine lactone efflux protein